MWDRPRTLAAIGPFYPCFHVALLILATKGKSRSITFLEGNARLHRALPVGIRLIEGAYQARLVARGFPHQPSGPQSARR